MAKEYRQNTPYEDISNGEWDESKHPRDGDGKFTSGAGTSSQSNTREQNTLNLSKQDWARLYEKLGEIKRGGAVIRTSKGDMIIPLHKMSDGDTVKLVFIGGTYERPNARRVLRFIDEDEMNDFIEEIERGK